MWHLHKRKAPPPVKDMTSGKPYKLISAFAVPIFLSQLFQQLYSLADTFIVGKFLGTSALAAVSSSGNLIFMMISFFSGISLGAGVVISRYFGAADNERVRLTIHTNIAFGIACGILLTVVGVIFTPYFLIWMNTDPDVLPQAIEYFRFYFMGGLPRVLYGISRDIMAALGDSRRPLYYLIFSSVTNILLDLLFVGLFRWGVWSAAVATILAEAFSVLLCFRHLCNRDFVYRLRWREVRFHWDILREVLRMGLPSGIQNSVISIANVIVQAQINIFGQFAMAASGIYSRLGDFAFLPIISFNMAITTFISQNLGAGEYRRAKEGARFGILAATVLAELIGVLFFIFAPQLIAIFDDTPQVMEYGVTNARIVTLFYFLLAFSHSVAAVCRGAGRAFVPMLIMLLVWCVLRVIYIWLVMHFLGAIKYIYWAYPLTWAISSLIYLAYYHWSDWVHGVERKKPKERAELNIEGF